MFLSTAVSISDERFLRGHTGLMIVLLSGGLLVVRLGRRVLPPLLPTVITDLSITPFEAGIALSVASMGFALLQFPGGRLSDQLTRKTVLLASFAIVLVGAFLLSITTTYAMLLLGAAVAGIGEGLYGAADRGLISDLFVKKRGAAFGIHTTFGDIAGVAAAALATGALAIGIWQSSFYPAFAGAGIIAVLVYKFGREPVVVEKISPQVRDTVGRLFGQRRFQLMLLAYSLFSITSQGVIGFLPALLQADQGFTTGQANAAFAGLFATGIVARPMAGRLSDSGNRQVVAGMGLLVGVVGLLTLVTAISPLLVFIGVVVFATGQKAFPPAMQSHMMDAFPDASMAGDLGATRTFYISVGSIGPAYVGYIASRSSYTAAFIGFIFAFLVGGLIILSLALTE